MKLLLAFTGVLLAGQVSAAVKLPAILSDHVVFTRAPQVPIWGWANPGETITVTLHDQTATTTATAEGKWRVDLDLSEFDTGPFDLIVEGNTRLVVKDAVVGEVWLASGQSNMEWTIGQSLEAREEAARPPDPLVRQFKMARATSIEPSHDCDGKWTIASPETVGEFTAVGYFFAKEISSRHGTPVGLLNASWGGMNIERWISAQGFTHDPVMKQRALELVDATRESIKEVAIYQKSLSDWENRFDRKDLRAGKPSDFASPSISTEDWLPVMLPGKLSDAGLPDAGVIWLRRTVNVPKVLTSTQFNIGAPQGFVDAYWNGKHVGDTSPSNLPGGPVVSFFIPEESIVPGDNTLAIRIYQPAGGAGILKPETSAFSLDYGGKPLDGQWLAKVERALPQLTPGAAAAHVKAPIPVRPLAVPSGMFNAMVHPLMPHAIRGVLWYQGESNIERAAQYETALKLLIEGWRESWEQPDLPFLICQLANLGKPPAAPGDSKWAELRESQLKSLSIPNTSITVLVDAGEAEDIHPRSKKIAGHRLSLAARALAHGERIDFSGPVYDKMITQGDTIRLHFKHSAGGLVAHPLPQFYKPRSNQPETVPLVLPSPDSELQGFAICGADRKWVWADARIEGGTVLVRAPGVNSPLAVRYAWADNPVCNLYNSAGLPASPFRTDDFPLSARDATW